MRINYEFLTGERLEIEVDDDIGEVIIEMEKMQSRRNRAEMRRHNSLEFMQEIRDGYSPMQFADNRADVEQIIIHSDEKERLHRAIQKLDRKDSIIVKKYYFEDKTMAEVGKELGITAMAVSKRLKKIPDKIKKLLD
ncbi:RNA polymerase sigma factor (sigma-70 family) [Lachnotalea glycerini]|uniref:RNA polymerase sigma factor (Sigma-70 family) n=1 Tax=Lachnotalea glycerini TaxID=1763509 RepID=A0A318F060_9FIRM|nr:sigma-70 family RNA polymerase sigma factor [Lachnotalea glycerini]PXV93754.1 RNA polymerase sigma factor (sigma-70 family) [Lachnotalea glycerini]